MLQKLRYTFSVRHPSFFATRVRSLFIRRFLGTSDVAELLMVCPGLKEFTYMDNYHQAYNPKLFSSLIALRPMRLSANLSKLLGMENPNFRLPLFEDVKYLSFQDPSSTWIKWTWDGIETLHHLSHIALEIYHDMGTIHDSGPWAPTVLTLLSQCESLKVLVIRTDSPDRVTQSIRRPGSKLLDPRLVFLSRSYDIHHDWEAVRRGDRWSGWAYAEQRVAAQRAI